MTRDARPCAHRPVPAMSVSPEVVAASLERLEGLSMSASDMRRLAHSPPTWALGSPRPGDMVLCAKEPLRLGVVTDVTGNSGRKVALAGPNGGSRFAWPANLRALPAAALAGRPSTALRSVDEMVRGTVVVAFRDLVDEVARRALLGDAVAPRELLARRGSAGGGGELGDADASGDGRGVFYSRCRPPVNGGAVEVFVSGNAGNVAQQDAAAAEASATLEPLHFYAGAGMSKASSMYLEIAGKLGEVIIESTSRSGGDGITPAAALLLFAKRESRKLMILGGEERQLNFWKYSDLWTCVNPDVNTITRLRLIPKREEPEVAVEPLSLLLYREKKCSEKYVSFSKVIAKAIKAAHAAAEQNPISIAVVLKQAEELEGCTVSILGEDRKRLKFWKNSEFWDVVSKGAKSLGSIRLLPKSAAPAVGKRAASGAAEPAKKKRARK